LASKPSKRKSPRPAASGSYRWCVCRVATITSSLPCSTRVLWASWCRWLRRMRRRSR
jgi:hypothetical protein